MKTNEIDAAAEIGADMLWDVRGFIERGWTQGATARAVDDHPCSPRDLQAECWCLLGAAIAVTKTKTTSVAHALGFETGVGMVLWNDESGRTQAEVLARIDQALERAGGGE